MSRKLDYQDYEGSMAKSQLMKIENYARKLNEMIHPDDELEAWVQSKLSVVAAYMGDIKHYLDYELKEIGEDFDDDDDEEGQFIRNMEQAKEEVGDEIWDSLSEDEKIGATKYLKQKGKVGFSKGGAIGTHDFKIRPYIYHSKYYFDLVGTEYHGQIILNENNGEITLSHIDWDGEYVRGEGYTRNIPTDDELIEVWIEENLDKVLNLANQNN